MSDMAIDLPIRPITVDEYHAMARAGIFAAGERVELLDGMLVSVPPHGGPHIDVHTRLVKYLILKLGDAVAVAGQSSLPFRPRDEPEPDIVVFSAREGMLRAKSWTSADIFAVVEISDSSLRRDTVSKQRIYARGDVQEYLVVDAQHERLIRFTQPEGDHYGCFETLRRGDTFTLKKFPDIVLEVAAFLPSESI